jgi:hypothetical protein
MGLAIEIDNTCFVEELAKFRRTISLKIEKRRYNEWLELGIENINTGIVESILLLKPRDGKVNCMLFSTACRSGSVDMINLLLDDDEADIDDGTLMTNFLCCAIKAGDIAVIGAVLDAGANINVELVGRVGVDHPVLPMELAVKQQSKAVLELLMSRRAIMPPHTCWPDNKNQHTMIQEVAIANGPTNVPVYRRSRK